MLIIFSNLLIRTQIFDCTRLGMKTLLLAICLLIISINNISAANLFKWVDKEGRVHYGDKPDEDAVKAEQKKFAAPSANDDNLSYGVRKAKQDFPVTMFVASNCGEICVQARALLSKRGVPFAEKNLTTQEDIDAFKAKTGGDTIPTLMIGKFVLKGYEAGIWNSELDIAGYPKIAPYGSRPVRQAKPEASVEPAK